MEVPMVIEGTLSGGTARFAADGHGYLHLDTGDLEEVSGLSPLRVNEVYGEAHALGVSAPEYAFLYEMAGEGVSTIRLEVDDDYAIGLLCLFYCAASLSSHKIWVLRLRWVEPYEN
jgi:hypothetical protein